MATWETMQKSVRARHRHDELALFASVVHLTLQSALVHFAIEVIKRTSIATMAIYVLVSPTKVSSSFVDAITRAIIRAVHRVHIAAVSVNFDRHMALCCISTFYEVKPTTRDTVYQ